MTRTSTTVKRQTSLAATLCRAISSSDVRVEIRLLHLYAYFLLIVLRKSSWETLTLVSHANKTDKRERLCSFPVRGFLEKILKQELSLFVSHKEQHLSEVHQTLNQALHEWSV